MIKNRKKCVVDIDHLLQTYGVHVPDQANSYLSNC